MRSPSVSLHNVRVSRIRSASVLIFVFGLMRQNDICDVYLWRWARCLLGHTNSFAVWLACIIQACRSSLALAVGAVYHSQILGYECSYVACRPLRGAPPPRPRSEEPCRFPRTPSGKGGNHGGTSSLFSVTFFRSQTAKTKHRYNGKYHAAVRPELVEGQAKRHLNAALRKSCH
jgi:hypothetical protein